MKDLDKATRKHLLAMIHSASADCYMELEKRCKHVMIEGNAEAAKEVVASGAGTVARFENYLIEHLGLQEENYQWKMN